MTTTDLGRRARLGHRRLERMPATGRARIAVRALVLALLVAILASQGWTNSPMTTIVLGAAAILWLMLSFEADRPA